MNEFGVLFLMVIIPIISVFLLYKLIKNVFVPTNPKHVWDKNSEKWIWKDNKPVRKATPQEELYQLSWGIGKIAP
jgi:hypothetical protein